MSWRQRVPRPKISRPRSKSISRNCRRSSICWRRAAPGSPLVHEQWGDNVFLESRVEADLSEIKKTAPVVVRRTLRTARQCMSPMEGRGVVAVYDRRLEQIVLHTATQIPHIIRTGLAGCLGVSEDNVRIVAPDIGGGFGYKGMLLSEEVCAAFLARHLGHPVRWLEDRREQLAGNANCREHHYDITAYADSDGRLIALDAAATVDTGAYSIYPFSACLEAAQVASILPGPYKFDAYRCITWSSATNKPRPCAVSRRRAGGRLLCDGSRHGCHRPCREQGALRSPAAQSGSAGRNAVRQHHQQAFLTAATIPNVCAVSSRPSICRPCGRSRKMRPDSSVRIGVGFSIFCEQGAHGTSVYYGWGIPMVPGFEQAVARLTPDGGLELRVGIQSHGQGLETTLAQIGHEVLGIPIERIRVVHGDTAVTPYSTGTWGSRCIVMAGGAVATACKELGERIARIGAHLLQVPADKVRGKGRTRVDRHRQRAGSKRSRAPGICGRRNCRRM